MENWDKINAVDRMQKYIVAHLEEPIGLKEIAAAASYSPYYALRVFKDLTGSTPMECLRGLRLTMAAKALRDAPHKVIDVAAEHGFDSHDGFTRAFKRMFAITPERYRAEKPVLPFFHPYPVRDPYIRAQKQREDIAMHSERKVPLAVTVTPIHKPARKMIILRSIHATEYFSYCEEVGCENWGVYESVAEALDGPALLTLPEDLIAPGTSATASGIEVPLDYAKQLPEGYELIELPECEMLAFTGMPFEDPEDYGEAIGIVWEAICSYKPELYGYQFDNSLTPIYNFGAEAADGARFLMPARKIPADPSAAT